MTEETATMVGEMTEETETTVGEMTEEMETTVAVVTTDRRHRSAQPTLMARVRSTVRISGSCLVPGAPMMQQPISMDPESSMVAISG